MSCILKTFCIVCGKHSHKSRTYRIPVTITFSNMYRQDKAGVCSGCAKSEDIKPYLIKEVKK